MSTTLRHRTAGFHARLFVANDAQNVTFPGNGLNPSGNILASRLPGEPDFRVFSIAHTYNFHNAWLNDARIGHVRTRTSTQAISPFKWSDVGVEEGEMSNNNELPSLKILGSVSIASGFPRTITQNSFVFSDILSFVHGRHDNSTRRGGHTPAGQYQPRGTGFFRAVSQLA